MATQWTEGELGCKASQLQRVALLECLNYLLDSTAAVQHTWEVNSKWRVACTYIQYISTTPMYPQCVHMCGVSHEHTCTHKHMYHTQLMLYTHTHTTPPPPHKLRTHLVSSSCAARTPVVLIASEKCLLMKGHSNSKWVEVRQKERARRVVIPFTSKKDARTVCTDRQEPGGSWKFVPILH